MQKNYNSWFFLVFSLTFTSYFSANFTLLLIHINHNFVTNKELDWIWNIVLVLYSIAPCLKHFVIFWLRSKFFTTKNAFLKQRRSDLIGNISIKNDRNWSVQFYHILHLNHKHIDIKLISFKNVILSTDIASEIRPFSIDTVEEIFRISDT